MRPDGLKRTQDVACDTAASPLPCPCGHPTYQPKRNPRHHTRTAPAHDEIGQRTQIGADRDSLGDGPTTQQAADQPLGSARFARRARLPL